MSDFDEIRSFIRARRAPTTLSILVLSVALYLVEWLFGHPLCAHLMYVAGNPAQPWAALTYPFAQIADGRDVIGLIFECWWLWIVGSMVERDMQSSRFAAFWIAMTVLPALFLAVAMTFMHGQLPLFEMGLPLAAVTVAWAARYPNECVRLYMVLPIKAKWIGWLSALLVMFSYADGVPIVGMVAVLHLLAAWAIAAGRVPFFPYLPGRSRAARLQGIGYTRSDKMRPNYFDNVRKREQERAEKERLRKIFERSLIDDPPKDDR